MNEQWIKQMQQKMADYKQPAPKVSWDAIDQAISAVKHQKQMPLWLRGIAAAIVLILITGISLRLMHHPEETIEQKTIITNPDNKEQITTVNEEQPLQESEKSPTYNKQTAYLTESSNNKKNSIISQTVISTDYTEESALSDTIDDITPTDISEEQSVLQKKNTQPGNFSSEIPIPTTNKKHQTAHLMAKAYFSSNMTDKRITESGPHMFYSNDDESDNQKPLTKKNNSTYRHHPPIRFGLSLQYPIDERWSLESGLSYALLISDIPAASKGQVNASEQRLYYIGIPFNINYQLWTRHRYGLYVTAGGTIDKLLNGSDWQFSLSGAAGAEYLLNNRFSLYLEPCIGYYFPNGSNLSTIYKDYPLNFNLSLGLRFNLK